MTDSIKVIEINKYGNISIKSIHLKKLAEYDFYAPITDKKYPLSVAVKEDSFYEDEPNEKANEIFKRNDLKGKVYIVLENIDDYDSDDSEYDIFKENKNIWNIENLFNDINNNILVS